MRVSEIARAVGLAPSAVRFYEDIGVIPRARRTAAGYRDYRDEDVARLRLVVALRRIGLGPADAGRLAKQCLERRRVDPELAPVLAAQRETIGRQRAELDRLDAELGDLERTIAAVAEAPQDPAPRIRVLFVCTGNSARSQMAEAMLQTYGGPDFEVHSAGTEPKRVNPLAVRTLAELGIDWSHAQSKPVADFLGQPFDYVITLCEWARQSCPTFPDEHNRLHWDLADPADVDGTDVARLDAFRATREAIAARLRPFVVLARQARSAAPTAGSAEAAVPGPDAGTSAAGAAARPARAPRASGTRKTRAGPRRAPTSGPRSSGAETHRGG